MSAVLPRPARDAARAGPLAVFDAWRSVTRREVAAFVLLGLSLSGILVLMVADTPRTGLTPARLLAAAVDPLLYALICLLAWLPADRAPVDRARGPGVRTRRLVMAVVAGSAIGAWLVPDLIVLLGLPDNLMLMLDAKGKAPPPPVMRRLGEFLNIAVSAGLLVAVMELLTRRRRTEQAVQRALLEQAVLSRQALEARLAAMQAQVEPQFLFDVLVDVERLYAQSEAAGAAQLERLIGHLRVALPRLRESGSTLGAEADLLASYLAVVQGSRHGVAQPALRYGAHIPGALQGASFHPMLLLPLVQRALRGEHSTVEAVTLSASADPTQLRLTLTLTGADLCRDDAELACVRERLHALYDGAAVLACTAIGGAQPGSTFTMTVPR